ncbi:MAG: rRNA ((527)-N(7))-methyltransferase RsmG [Bacteroidota bacterium]|jgi:16S rRNA (guanine527-N7)-methyltransferase
MSVSLLSKYFPDLTPKQLEQFEMLQSVYAEWNEKINVISRKDIEALYERHVLHSLAIYKFLPFQPQSSILDIGTGGGFPGIPLAIVHPEVEFLLVDSIGKKITVVNEVAGAIGLTNVRTRHARAEDVKEKFDFVVSRAVAELSTLWRWSQGKFKKEQMNALPNGLICLKGGDLKEELTALKRSKEVYALPKYFKEPFFETKALVYVAH